MQRLLKKSLFAIMACVCLTANAEEYRAIVHNNSANTDPLLVMIRINSMTADGSGFFASAQIAQGASGELIAEKNALLARYINAQEARIINQAGKVVTLEVQCNPHNSCFGTTLPAPIELSVDPAITPEYDITGGGEEALVMTPR